ncbi:hypothetical protein JCM19241_5982 [Vibrio ishigakensis]|uniref:Uncharacterized protein n=1 Tax=Vibrio ishigakensis TaxID=1481914 RepID=A0A0B8QEQ3_9VIBR|nr:hypothetical protein JCM19241_5982 [Vibrio ishigakensis]
MNFLYGNSHNQTDNFKYIDWTKLCEIVTNPEQSEFKHWEHAKANAPVIAATDATAKTKPSVISHNNMTMIRVDVDDSTFDIDDIKHNLESVLCIESYIIHSTHRAYQIDTETGEDFGPRWRVYIELSKPLTVTDWAMAQDMLSDFLDGDGCASRPQQIMYLPTRYDGDEYQFYIGSGTPYERYGMITEYCREIAEEHASDNEKTIYEPPKNPVPLVGNQVSLIDVFNQHVSVESVIRNGGYKKSGKKWKSPWSTSTAGGIIYKPKSGGERYTTYSETEQGHLGLSEGCGYDAFDMYCKINHQDNVRSALKAIGDMPEFQSVTKHNAREYMINKHNEEVEALNNG